MALISLGIRIRPEPALPDDDAEAHRLVEIVRPGIARGARGGMAIAIRPERSELFDLRPLVAARIPIDGFLAALSRSAPPGQPMPLAVGLAGRFQLRRGGAEIGVGLVFLEWADCRWWQWQRILREGVADEDELETVRRAVDGDPLPDGLGRWFTRGRRTRSSLSFGDLRMTHSDQTVN